MSEWSSAYVIAGMRLEIVSWVGDPAAYLPVAMGEFAVREPGAPDIAITLREDESAEADPLKLFFPSQFALHRGGDAGDLSFVSTAAGGRRLGGISSSATRAEIGLPALDRGWRIAEEEAAVREALQAFVRGCLQYRLLGSGGTLLHAAGVVWEGDGFVFSGHTRSGKTTLSRDFPAACILGDDLVAVRKRREGFALFGTPWPGREGGTVAYGGVGLLAALNLHPARESGMRRQPRGEALAELMANAPRLGYAGEESKLLDIFSSLVAEIPIYAMSFRLGDDAAAFLARIRKEESGRNTSGEP